MPSCFRETALPQQKLTPLVLILLFAAPAASHAASLKGEWRAAEFKEMNSAESWKPICGNRPPRHKRLPTGLHKIKMFNNEFNVFRGTTRVLSSYKCNSSNTKVKLIQHQAKGKSFSTTCGSSRSDDIYEVGTYTFKLIHQDRIEYSEQTMILRTEEGVECTHRRQVKAVFVRAGSIEESLVVGLAGDKPGGDGGGETPAKPACPPPETQRPITKLSLAPSEQTLAPGQRACFSAKAMDAAGCTVNAAPKFALAKMPDGVTASVDAKGCVSIADAPGLGGKFNVVAAVGPQQGKAEVLIGIPTPRKVRKGGGKTPGTTAGSGDVEISVGILEPTGEVDAAWLNKHNEEMRKYRERMAEAAETNYVMFAIFLGMLLLGVVALVFVVLGHGKASAAEEVILYVDHVPGSVSKSASATKAEPKLVLKKCPKCGKSFQSNARFCPFDRGELVEPGKDSAAAKAAAAGGSLRRCPKCGRAFESKGKFCPFDRTKLVQVTAEEAAKASAGEAKRKCPTCGRVFDKGKFCPFDRAELTEA